MALTVWYFDDCPGWRLMLSRLEEARRTTGEGRPVELRCIDPDADPQRLGFRGSPTLLIDEVDPFARPAEPFAMACRMYPVGERLEPAPSVAQLVDVLTGAESG